MDLFDWMEGLDPNEMLGKPEGIRLHKLEIYNWGTFDESVWVYEPKGDTSLLTGDSGSGKSTVVDAITTLLVPPRKIAYNKAADASARERTVNSYVLGYYGRKHAYDGKGKPEALRKNDQYAVILATFLEETTKTSTTLAIFFWYKENDKNPSRFYVVSENELFITKDFGSFGASPKILKDQLKKKGALVFEEYSKYAGVFRKRMGNISEQAMELFQQTISMKKVEALNDFVRSSMLEKEDVETEIQELLKHYRNLNSAYEAVARAKKQILELTPIDEKGKTYTEQDSEKIALELARESIPYWFARKKEVLLLEEIKKGEGQYLEIGASIETKEGQLQQKRDEISHVRVAIEQNGGAELTRLEQELKHKEEELIRRRDTLGKYNSFARGLSLKEGHTAESFYENKKELPLLLEAVTKEKEGYKQRMIDCVLKSRNENKEKQEIDDEIRSLRSRTSNIPKELIELRDKLCNALQLKEEQLPFIGELLEVKGEEAAWEGAIERLVHGFALSLLVPEEQYHAVATWVNEQHLKTKLVYYRVGKKIRSQGLALEGVDQVFSKVLVKKDTIFSQWLGREIEHRFPHVCCDDISAFQREQKAITKLGQIKSNQRHEKDDRSLLGDRRKYVLGFSNHKKIESLLVASLEKQKKVEALQKEEKALEQKQDALEQKRDDLHGIRSFETFEDLNAKATEAVIEKIKEKIQALTTKHNILQTLEKQLKALMEEEKKETELLTQLQKRHAVLEDAIKNRKVTLKQTFEKLALETAADQGRYDFLSRNFPAFVGKEELTLQTIGDQMQKYNEGLSQKISKLNDSLGKLRSEIERKMTAFRNAYPAQSNELSDRIEGLKEYQGFLKQLRYHNLPKYEETFQGELRDKTILHITLVQSKLEQYRRLILSRIEQINASMRSIDYRAGTYITILCENTPEGDIQAFRAQLKDCTTGMLSNIDGDEAQRKFLQIKEIIARFEGRSQFVEMDKRWTEKVTDVRNWFVFSASERWRDTEAEFEHYSDSDGKSGGQKEKLAYTILAASLAYNYRVDDKENNGSSFRLVIIDEAFLKSSDDAAKYGLMLFAKLKFQLMVVTPLLKISTIEPFISHVGFVAHSDITHRSSLKNITMEVYQQKRKERGEFLGQLD